MTILLFFKLGVVHFMLNSRGSTLIEALLAFMIMVSIFVTYLGLFQSVYMKKIHINKEYQILMEKECDAVFQEEFADIIETVLP